MSTAFVTDDVETVARPGVFRRLWADRSGQIGVVLVGLVLLVGLLGAFGVLDPPSLGHWFGTDQFGRDIAARTFAGIFASLRVSALAVLLAAVIGGLLGILAGFAGGFVDAVVGRCTDVLFAFPAILLALALVAALGHGWINTAIAISVVYVPIFVRVARGPVLAVRESDYVRAARTLGFSPARILFRHVLPNVSAPLGVQTALALSWGILTESALSFLGLGAQPPDPSLGLMVNDARNLLTEAWWTLAAPAAAIVVTVVGLNLLADGLRSATDPRSRR
jgi:peptide/nickel transport system permease protein